MKEGYPDRVCDYCQLQLHTFHAFVRKAKMTSNRFEDMIQELRKQNIEEDHEANDDTTEQSNDLLSSTDMEFDMQHDDDVHDKNGSNEEIEVEFLVGKTKVELTSDIGDMVMSVNGDEGKTQNCTYFFS